MKIAVMSDTHYGFSAQTHEIHEKFLNTVKEQCEIQDVKALVHCGDWIANNQHQLPRTWKMFRNILGELPILAVTGNHDKWCQEWWNTKPSKKRYAKHPAGMSLPAMEIQHREWAEEYQIHLLENNPFFLNDISFYGFNGWYGSANPPTNDSINMALMYETAPAQVYFSYQAGKELDKVLGEADQTSGKKVCVTHFPPYTKNPAYEVYCANTSYLDFIAEKFDLLLVGHSHQQEDWYHPTHTNCRIVNPGTHFDVYSGGYNKPNFVIIDI